MPTDQSIIVTLACLLLSTTGCIATGQYKFLAADAPGGVRETGYDDYHVITVLRSPDQVRVVPQPGLEVVVRACNREATSAITVGPFIPVVPWPPSIVMAVMAAPTPPLVVSINFAAGVGYTFDPQRVTVRTPDGGTFSATRFAAKPNAGVCSFQPSGPLPEQPITIRGPVAVALQFDLPDIPAQPFAVEIAGIQSGTTAVDVPRIELRHSSEWILYPFNS